VHSGYSEHTGTSSRTGNFICDAMFEGGTLRDIFAGFKYFIAAGGAKE
jgi:hypothetical protein